MKAKPHITLTNKTAKKGRGKSLEFWHLIKFTNIHTHMYKYIILYTYLPIQYLQIMRIDIFSDKVNSE